MGTQIDIYNLQMTSGTNDQLSCMQELFKQVNPMEKKSRKFVQTSC